jgi:hypothetical protein
MPPSPHGLTSGVVPRKTHGIARSDRQHRQAHAASPGRLEPESNRRTAVGEPLIIPTYTWGREAWELMTATLLCWTAGVGGPGVGCRPLLHDVLHRGHTPRT